MSEYGFTKKDWTLFREKVADLQEAYMDKLNKEYDERDYLAGVAAPASLSTHRVRGCNEIYHLK